MCSWREWGIILVREKTIELLYTCDLLNAEEKSHI